MVTRRYRIQQKSGILLIVFLDYRQLSTVWKWLDPFSLICARRRGLVPTMFYVPKLNTAQYSLEMASLIGFPCTLIWYHDLEMASLIGFLDLVSLICALDL